MRAWSNFWKNISWNPWIMKDKRDINHIDDVEEIKKAVEEMDQARSIYSQVDDPEMVDWAVYSLTAAEKRYDYLLKKYRRKN